MLLLLSADVVVCAAVAHQTLEYYVFCRYNRFVHTFIRFSSKCSTLQPDRKEDQSRIVCKIQLFDAHNDTALYSGVSRCQCVGVAHRRSCNFCAIFFVRVGVPALFLWVHSRREPVRSTIISAPLCRPSMTHQHKYA